MKTYQLSTEANASDTQAVLDFIENTLNGEHISLKIIQRLLICTDEIYANIAQYSNADTAEIRCMISEDQVTLEFSDNGIPYNPLENPEPDVTKPAEDRTIGGYGIHIVKKFTNSIEYCYRENRNILSFSMRL